MPNAGGLRTHVHRMRRITEEDLDGAIRCVGLTPGLSSQRQRQVQQRKTLVTTDASMDSSLSSMRHTNRKLRRKSREVEENGEPVLVLSATSPMRAVQLSDSPPTGIRASRPSNIGPVASYSPQSCRETGGAGHRSVAFSRPPPK